jgi:uncharacterized protein
MLVPTEFTPFAGTAGGTLIGLAAVLLMSSAGKIMGVSGIWRGILTVTLDDHAKWRWLFVAGLLIGAIILSTAIPQLHEVQFGSNIPITMFGGLLVGAGVTLGGGCTSGHGICGISRFSLRSISATLTFMAVAIITVFITRHVIG